MPERIPDRKLSPFHEHLAIWTVALTNRHFSHTFSGPLTPHGINWILFSSRRIDDCFIMVPTPDKILIVPVIDWFGTYYFGYFNRSVICIPMKRTGLTRVFSSISINSPASLHIG